LPGLSLPGSVEPRTATALFGKATDLLATFGDEVSRYKGIEVRPFYEGFPELVW
jgi:hypothetical protein